MQLFTAHPVLYRRHRIDTTDHPVALERLAIIKKVEQAQREGITVNTALALLGIARSTYYDWLRRFRQGGVKGLVPKSRCPKTKRRPAYPRAEERRVLAMRRAWPFCGKLRIYHVLCAQVQGCALSASTVGRILSKGMALGRIRPVAFLRGRVRAKRPRDFHNGHARRWQPTDRAQAPGEFVQVDHMTVHHDGVTFKEFRAVCPVTRRMLARVYPRATANNARDFLKTLQAQMPVLSVQVDGGSEFRQVFETHCAEQALPLVVLPPKSPELNGCVERANSTVRTEFWSLYDGELSIEAINSQLTRYLHYYNEERPHRSLGMLTPSQYSATLPQAA